MFLLLLFYPSSAYAAEFDRLLYDCISEKGVYSDKDGIIYAAAIENDTMLAVISTENNSFTVSIFGSENEPADSLSIDFGTQALCRISITDSADDFCLTVRKNKQYSHYRLINDAFTVSNTAPKISKPIAEYKKGKIRLYTQPSEIYSLINSFKLERINHIPYEEADVSASDKARLLNLLRACADIYEYDYQNTDTDLLMRKVLYTHKNFTILTSSTLESSEKNPSLKLCNEEYITSVVYNAFRKEAKRPAINMLTEIGYCYNNGYYYYTGGYSGYFNTEVHDILKIFKADNNSLYVVFSDTYTENDTSVREYSSAIVKKDKDGYYLTTLKMGDDFRDIFVTDNSNTQSESNSSVSEVLKDALPFIVLLFTLAAVGVVIYFYIIRP